MDWEGSSLDSGRLKGLVNWERQESLVLLENWLGWEDLESLGNVLETKDDSKSLVDLEGC